MSIPSFFQHFTDTRTAQVLRKGMEGTLARTQASMNNLANVDTPGYKRQTVSFEDQLRSVLRGGAVVGRVNHPRHIEIKSSHNLGTIQPRLHTDRHTSFRADGNNVDIDQEMVAITGAASKNVQYTELLSRFYTDVRNVIRERI